MFLILDYYMIMKYIMAIKCIRALTRIHINNPRSDLSEDDPVSPLPSYPLFDGFCEPSQELPSTSASPDSTEGATSNGPADAPKQVSSDFKSVVQKLRLHLMTHHTSTRSG